MNLAWRRIRVVTVTVALTDAAIATVNEQFTPLVPRDFPGDTDGLSLSLSPCSHPRASSGLHSPTTIVGNNMLVRQISPPFLWPADSELRENIVMGY